MPTFPNGSRVWICDSNKVPFAEYGESSEVTEEPNGGKTHTTTVYIASQKGQEFQAAYNLKPEGTAHIHIDISVDGQNVDKLSYTRMGQNGFCKGWRDAYTTQHLSFASIDVEENKENEQCDKSKQLLSSCIEITFYPAVITGYYAPRPLAGVAKVAAPVNPDSKAATLVGVQVKPGQKVFNPTAAMTCGYSLGKAPNATKYVARIFYRPERILIAQDIMPAPKDAKRKAYAESDDELDHVKAKAGPSDSKKKLKAKAEPGVKKEGQSSKNAIEIDAGPKNQKFEIDLTAGDSDDE